MLAFAFISLLRLAHAQAQTDAHAHAYAHALLPPPRELCSEPFTIKAVQVNAPGSKFPLDFEFDHVGYRIFGSRNKEIFIQDLDPATGLFTSGRQVIDSGVVKFWTALGEKLARNGPEWSNSARGSELYYMKQYGQAGNNRILYKANERSPDVWTAGALPEGAGRGFPEPSKDPGDAVPKILYARSPTGVQDKFPYDIALRSVPEDPASEQVIPAAVDLEQGAPRWVSGTNQVVFSFLDANDVEQVALYDMDSQLIEQVTFYTQQDGVSVDEAWTSPYPELGSTERVVWFVANGTELRVFQKEDGNWNEVNRINASQVLGKPEKPYIVSPEPFTYGAKPYIAFQLSEAFLSVDNGIADIYVMQPQATTSCHFRLISPGNAARRRKPEPFTLQDKVVVYFSEGDAEGRVLYQAETGL